MRVESCYKIKTAHRTQGTLGVGSLFLWPFVRKKKQKQKAPPFFFAFCWSLGPWWVSGSWGSRERMHLFCAYSLQSLASFSSKTSPTEPPQIPEWYTKKKSIRNGQKIVCCNINTEEGGRTFNSRKVISIGL